MLVREKSPLLLCEQCALFKNRDSMGSDGMGAEWRMSSVFHSFWILLLPSVVSFVEIYNEKSSSVRDCTQKNIAFCVPLFSRVQSEFRVHECSSLISEISEIGA